MTFMLMSISNVKIYCFYLLALPLLSRTVPTVCELRTRPGPTLPLTCHFLARAGNLNVCQFVIKDVIAAYTMGIQKYFVEINFI